VRKMTLGVENGPAGFIAIPRARRQLPDPNPVVSEKAEQSRP
jgi:hypothetical protein